ncbi:unnamed protein product [Haemonchus placei]|uniref:Uncharacterized protein n=1 Tax=Haemonchus placei TaxID=6290 RepID=A0A0N4WEQ0_HAEPC|nr:unnamed protein product [Haemonchus placei]
MNVQQPILKDRFTIHRHINPQYAESSDSERRTEQKRWQKQPTVVAKRNARERTRVHTVNQSYDAANVGAIPPPPERRHRPAHG